MNNNTSSSSSFTTTHRTVLFRGNGIETTVTKKASSIDAWVQEFRSANQGSNIIVGLDCEWKPHYNRNMSNTTATLQLCGANKCIIIQLFYVDYIPESIKGFLADGNITFVGVGVDGDVAKLKNEYGLHCEKWADLEPLCNRYLRRSAFARRLGLKGYAREVVGIVMDKPMTVTMSNWEARDLSEAQVQYACIDAYVSYRLGCRVLPGN